MRKLSMKISKSSKKKLIITIIVLVSFYCLCGLFSCSKKAPGRPPVAVVISQAIEKDIPLYIDGIGHCSSIESVKIVPEVTGKIVSINFKQGDKVAVNNVLFVIDSRPYESVVEIAKAQLERAESQLKISLSKLERSRPLVPQNYISKQEFETIESQANSDKASVDAAYGQLKQAKINLEHCTIISPINGITGKYGVDIGNVVFNSASQILTTVENIDKIYVDFAISENHFADLQKYFSEANGVLNAEIEAISNSSLKAVATINFIDNKINSNCGMLNLRAVVDNAEHKFWAGQSVRVTLHLCVKKKSVLVPVESVKLGQKGYFVFVIKETNIAELRFVDIGQRHGEMIAINNGIVANENVVVCGQFMLAPGLKVMPSPDKNLNTFNSQLEYDKRASATNPTTN